jgi:Cu+-exporting ATPase
VEKKTIPINGISCASCVATIEGALRQATGVVSASVNLATNAATVEFVPATVTLQGISRAIRDVGYEPPVVAEGADREKAARQGEVRVLKTRLTVAMALTAPVFLGSFPEWFPWVPRILQNSWVLLLLATRFSSGRGPVLPGAWAALGTGPPT